MAETLGVHKGEDLVPSIRHANTGQRAQQRNVHVPRAFSGSNTRPRVTPQKDTR